MDNYVHKGDIGIELIFDTGISDEITDVKIYYVKPDRTVGYWGDRDVIIENGIITYKTQAGDLDQVGSYKLQVYIKTDNYEIRSDVVSLYVKDII